MQPHPSESDVLVLRGERVDFSLTLTEDDPAAGPVFFLNGEHQPTLRFGGEISLSFGKAPVDQSNEQEATSIEFEEKASTNVTFNQAGFNDVTAVWSSDQDVDIVERRQGTETEPPDGCHSHRWSVYVLGEESDLDQVREVIDDLIRGGTLIYGGTKFIQWAHSKVGTDEDSSGERSDGEDDEEFFQENITNF